MVFLMKVMIKAVEALKMRLDIEGCLVVEPMGIRGGSALFWGSGLNLEFYITLNCI